MLQVVKRRHRRKRHIEKYDLAPELREFLERRPWSASIQAFIVVSYYPFRFWSKGENRMRRVKASQHIVPPPKRFGDHAHVRWSPSHVEGLQVFQVLIG